MWVLVRQERPCDTQASAGQGLLPELELEDIFPPPLPLPISLQVNFVAAIDVYEDGEAGLLLCYNCKSGLRPSAG